MLRVLNVGGSPSEAELLVRRLQYSDFPNRRMYLDYSDQWSYLMRWLAELEKCVPCPNLVFRPLDEEQSSEVA